MAGETASTPKHDKARTGSRTGRCKSRAGWHRAPAPLLQGGSGHTSTTKRAASANMCRDHLRHPPTPTALAGTGPGSGLLLHAEQC